MQKRKIIKNERRCRNGMPKSTQTRKDKSLIHPYIFSQRSEDVGTELCILTITFIFPCLCTQLPGVVANLTDVDGSMLTSTLTISSAGSVANESMIICNGLGQDRNTTVLRHRGEILIMLHKINSHEINFSLLLDQFSWNQLFTRSTPLFIQISVNTSL